MRDEQKQTPQDVGGEANLYPAFLSSKSIYIGGRLLSGGGSPSCRPGSVQY